MSIGTKEKDTHPPLRGVSRGRDSWTEAAGKGASAWRAFMGDVCWRGACAVHSSCNVRRSAGSRVSARGGNVHTFTRCAHPRAYAKAVQTAATARPGGIQPPCNYPSAVSSGHFPPKPRLFLRAHLPLLIIAHVHLTPDVQTSPSLTLR